MRMLKRGDRLVVASHNAGKVREIDDLIAPFGLEAVSAGELGLPEPEETEPTFVGNARLKALAAARETLAHRASGGRVRTGRGSAGPRRSPGLVASVHPIQARVRR